MTITTTIARLALATALIAVGGVPAAQTASAPAEGPITSVPVGSDWVVKSADSVCGVSEARQITNPAKVDYTKLMDATPEMKELKKKGIKKDSARGQTLVTAARDRVRRAANAVMSEKGHCSVWKKISHKKKKAVTDITDAVKTKLEA